MSSLAAGYSLTPGRRLVRFSVRSLARLITGLVADYSVTGVDQVPAKGPLLVVTNHLGLLDGPLLLAGFPRTLDAVVLDRMLAAPWVGTLLRWYGVVPVQRDRFDRHVLAASLEILRSGRALLIAPEAGVSDEAALRDARHGAAYLAVTTGAPVLPVAITGTETVHGVWDYAARKMSFRGLDQLARWPWGGDRPGLRLNLTLGAPFTLEAAGNSWRDKRETLRQATQRLMEQLAALLPPQYRGKYGNPVEADTPNE